MKALRVANEKLVENFMNKRIFPRYGVPKEIVTNQGIQFTFKMIEELMRTNKIRHMQPTPIILMKMDKWRSLIEN